MLRKFPATWLARLFTGWVLSGFVLIGIVLIGLGACDSGEQAAPDGAQVKVAAAMDPVAAVNALADEYVQAYFDTFPEQALLSGAPDSDPARLGDRSLDSLARWQVYQQDLLGKLEAIDVTHLDDPAARITANFLRNQLESARDLGICRLELWNVSPTWTGWLAEFTALADAMKRATPQQQADTLSRLSQIPAYVDTEVANLKEGVELGYTAAANSVRAVLVLLDSFLALPVAETPFAIAARDQDIGYQEKVAHVVGADIMPAIARYRDYLRNEYAAAARPAIGVDANPDGKACYRATVRYWATVDLGAEEIHRIGLAQMERVMAEISEIGARSFNESDPLVLLKRVKTEPAFLFSSRQEMVDYAEAALARSRDRKSVV